MELSQDAELFKSQGRRLYISGMHQKAIVWYNRAIKLDPKNSDIYFWKSDSLIAIQKNKEAVHCMNQVLILDPNSSKALFRKVEFLKGIGTNEEIIDCYDKAISINPLYMGVHQGHQI